MTEFNEDSNTPTKKVKVQVRAYHTLIFSAKLQQKVKVWHTLTWTFTFFVGIFAIFGELSHLSLLSGTSSILRTFLGGTSQKRHPVCWVYICDRKRDDANDKTGPRINLIMIMKKIKIIWAKMLLMRLLIKDKPSPTAILAFWLPFLLLSVITSMMTSRQHSCQLS